MAVGRRYIDEYYRIDREVNSGEVQKLIVDHLIRPMSKGSIYSTPRIFDLVTLVRKDDKTIRIVLVLRYRPNTPSILCLDLTAFREEEIALLLDILTKENVLSEIARDVNLIIGTLSKGLDKRIAELEEQIKTYKYTDIFAIRKVDSGYAILLPFLKRELAKKMG